MTSKTLQKGGDKEGGQSLGGEKAKGGGEDGFLSFQKSETAIDAGGRTVAHNSICTGTLAVVFVC